MRASPLHDPVSRRADRDGARRRRQSQPPAGRRTIRAAPLRPAPEPLGDAAIVESNGASVAITADSFVVRPLRFPGGSIGELAVNGTVNDLAVSGARAEALVVSYVLEAGLAHAGSGSRSSRDGRSRAQGGRDDRGRRYQSGRAWQGRRCTSPPRASAPDPRREYRSALRPPRRQDSALRAHRRSRHHDSAGARRARSRSRSSFRHALRAAVGGSAGCAAGARHSLDARSDARRGGDIAERIGARLRLGHRAVRRPDSGARCSARRLRVARPRSAAHCERRPVPRRGCAGVCGRRARRSELAPGGERGA